MLVASTIAVLSLTLCGSAYLVARLRSRLQQRDKELTEVRSRFAEVLSLDAERERVATELAAERRKAQLEIDTARSHATEAVETIRLSGLREEQSMTERRKVLDNVVAQLQMRASNLESEIATLEDTAALQASGFYGKSFEFATSEAFERAIADLERQQKEMVRQGRAAACATEWTVDGSKREGAKFVKKLLTLMLRAFNGECDAAIAKVKYNNVGTMVTRIRKSFEAINKLAETHRCSISPEYLRLRVDELYLVHAHVGLLHLQREEQRSIREQMREEEVARREIEAATREAEREEERYSTALEKARDEVTATEGAKQAKLLDKIAHLERMLAEARANKERAMARAQMTRSGHVYIISNVGAFGDHVYKIGMTRRLDPMDRIHELGDASVPFSFDVHAIIYSDDAPALENELHRRFDQRRLNLVNTRKEFFHVGLDEIVDVVRERHADILVTKVAEARDYRRSLAIVSEQGREQSRGWGSYDRRNEARPVSVA